MKNWKGSSQDLIKSGKGKEKIYNRLLIWSYIKPRCTQLWNTYAVLVSIVKLKKNFSNPTFKMCALQDKLYYSWLFHHNIRWKQKLEKLRQLIPKQCSVGCHGATNRLLAVHSSSTLNVFGSSTKELPGLQRIQIIKRTKS